MTLVDSVRSIERFDKGAQAVWGVCCCCCCCVWRCTIYSRIRTCHYDGGKEPQSYLELFDLELFGNIGQGLLDALAGIRVSAAVVPVDGKADISPSMNSSRLSTLLLASF